MNRSVLVMSTCGTLALCVGLAGRGTDAAPDPSYVVVALRALPGNLDPRTGPDGASQRVHPLIYSPLMTLDDGLRVVPHLAARLDNPDPLTYVAYLHSGVRFHDGHELTAADVVYTFERVLDENGVSDRQGHYWMLKSVEAVDAHIVKFTLKEPFDAFPTRLVTEVVPVDAGDSLQIFPVGTGPYRFARHDVDGQIVLSAFEGYWDGLPQNAGVVLRAIPDAAARVKALRAGTVDLVLDGVSPEVAVELRREGFGVFDRPGLDGAPGDLVVARPGVSGLRPQANLRALKDVRKASAVKGRFSS